MNFNKKFYDEVVEVFHSKYLSCIDHYEYDDIDIDADYLNQEFNWFCKKYDCRFAAGLFRISIIFNNEEYIIKYDKSLTKNCFAREQYYYQEAEKEGVKDFLVPIETYYTNSGIEYGVQKKVERPSFNSITKFSAEIEKSYNKIDDMIDICDIFNEEVFMFLIQYYGEDLTEEFCSFCYNFGIDDIHSGNYGYLNGAPMIFDYAGC